MRATREVLESITDRDALKRSPHVHVDKFGKDHWSLLGYIDYIVSNRNGFMEGSKIRVNEKRHVGIDRGAARICTWSPSSGSRLLGYFDNKNDSTLQLPEHDDIDCAEDMEAENLVTLGTTISGFVQLTNKGKEFANALRKYKEDGGNFADFGKSPLCTSLIKKYEYEEKITS